MAVPKQRKTTSKVKQRRKNIFISPKMTVICKNCNKDILPHIVCNFCGFYKGKKIINVLKKEKMEKEKEKAVSKTVN